MANTTITPTVGGVTLAGVAPTVAAVFAVGFTAATDVASGTVRIITWKNIPLTGGSQSAPIGYNFGSWRSFFAQVVGTFGAVGSIQLEGSNDGVNWFKLSPAALTSAGFFAGLGVTEQPLYIRPNATAGDGTTSLTVVAVVEGTI